MSRAEQIIAEWEKAHNTALCLDLSVLGLNVMPHLPSGVKFLNLFANNLTEIVSLPDTLIELSVSCNHSLRRLCKLPPTLRKLRCTQMLLTELPELPVTLEHLRCEGNQLSSLPALPLSLKSLYVNDNKLTHLPHLPPSLDTLFCFNNRLIGMPYLPPRLLFLLDYNNPFEIEDMHWGGNDVSDYMIHTHERIHKWLTHMGDRDIEERGKIWEEFFADYL